MPNTTPYRVVQWTTGNVGKSSVEAIAKNPNYELVGCYAWSKDKNGVDVGELVGIEPLGVAATNDVDALLALKPDCVVYNPMWNDVDELVRILSAGVNVVASASFITGHNLGDDRDRIEEACKQGGSTMFGSGVSPGFAELLAIVAATGCDRVDKVMRITMAISERNRSHAIGRACPTAVGESVLFRRARADRGCGRRVAGRPAGRLRRVREGLARPLATRPDRDAGRR